MERMHIDHPLEPVFDASSRVLVLGTMPSPVSRETGFYYGHPRNRFWRVMAALWDEAIPQSPGQRRAFALDHGVALWDVLASCEIAGASDASIADPVPNDLSTITGIAPIGTVFTTGAKAAHLYAKLCSDQLPGIEHIALPSTSAANARMPLDELVRSYRIIRERTE